MTFPRRPSYANVTSSLALFIALGGTSYAAIKLPQDSVGARELRPSAVRAQEIRSGAVRSSELRDGSILPEDLHRDLFRWLDTRATRGPEGPAGPPGPAGAAAAARFATVTSDGTLTHPSRMAVRSAQTSTGAYSVTFSRGLNGPDLEACIALGSLGFVSIPETGTSADDGGLLITPQSDVGGEFTVRVNTTDPDGQPRSSAFMLAMQCLEP